MLTFFQYFSDLQSINIEHIKRIDESCSIFCYRNFNFIVFFLIIYTENQFCSEYFAAWQEHFIIMTRFWLFPIYALRKRQKTYVCLVFSGVIKWEQWPEMD